MILSSTNFGYRLQADKVKSEAQPSDEVLPEPTGKGVGFWAEGKTPRDDFKRWARLYLLDVSSEYLDHPVCPDTDQSYIIQRA